MQQLEILPSRSQLNQKKLLEYCGVGFAAATASALFFPMPPVATLLENIEMAASVGMVATVLYDQWKMKGFPMALSSSKRRGVFSSFAPSIAYPRTATSAPRAAVKPTARVQANPRNNIYDEAVIVKSFLNESGIKLGISYYETPNCYVYKLNLASTQRFKDLDKLADDLERTIHKHRVAKRIINVGDRKAFVRCRFTMQPDRLEINRPDRQTLAYEDAQWQGEPFTALAGMAYPSRTGQPVVWDLADPTMPHALVCGTTGSGKSLELLALAFSLAESTSPEHLAMFVVDGGHHQLQALGSLPHCVSVETDYEGAATTLQAIRAIIKARKETGDDGKSGRVLLVVDEFANLSADILRELGADSQKEFISDLAFVTSEGRKWGVHCAIGTQKALADVTGSLSKSNIALRLVGLVTDKKDAVTSTGRAGSGAERLAGRGDFVQVLGSFVTRYQVPMVEYPLKLANEIGKRWRGKVRMNVDVLAAEVEPELPAPAAPRTPKGKSLPVEVTKLMERIGELWDAESDDFFPKMQAEALRLLGYPGNTFYRNKAKDFARIAAEA